MYQVIFMLRLATEYYFINQHSSNKFIKIIFYLSEPYFRIVQMFLPTGLFGAILGREGLRLISDGVKYSCRVLDTYSSNSLESTQLNLLLKLVFDEKILFRN
jgi:hypothetical protein